MKRIILTIPLLLMLSACDRIRRKGGEVVDQTKTTASEARQAISSKKDQLVDQVFPAYDSNRPDTKNNKQRFKEHLQVDLTSDVKNLYAYGDFLGADYKVLLSFSCDQATIQSIVAVKKMERTSKDDTGLLFPDELDWWDKDRIRMLQPYKAGEESVRWEYLWYDPKTRQAYYEAFSL